MIIVEGPDGAGKTTLIEALQERFDLPVAPRVVSKEAKAMVDLQQWVEDNLKLGFQRVIFDRHRLISEPIYGPILRTTQESGFTDARWLGNAMANLYDLKPIIIYCLPPLETVRKNLEGDEDNVAVVEFIEPIYAAYAARIAIDMYHVSKLRAFFWDYTQKHLTTDNEPWFFNSLAKILEESK